MKRMQIIVEDWHYEWLAEHGGQPASKSGPGRRLLTEAIERRRMGSAADDPLWGIIGLGEAPHAA